MFRIQKRETEKRFMHLSLGKIFYEKEISRIFNYPIKNFIFLILVCEKHEIFLQRKEISLRNHEILFLHKYLKIFASVHEFKLLD